MSGKLYLLIIPVYFLVLYLISYLTSRNANNADFFIGRRSSPWYVVAFGMVGASLSGVTFISVPGWTMSTNFSYMQMVLGYLAGYIVIAQILLPLYYRLNLTSIYTYLENRFGNYSYKTGAMFFFISRVVGASFRLYLVASVLQLTIFNAFDIPFWVSVLFTIVFIWIYTFKGGIKTIVWTDLLQTSFMLLAVLFTVIIIARDLNFSFSDTVSAIYNHPYSKTFFWNDWHSGNHFIKQFLSGAFITIVMTGLDQDMMQKNLSCKNVKEAKKNMYWFSITLVPVNLLFLSLGVLLFIFASKFNIPLEKGDDLFPLIATGGYTSPIVGIIFMLGLISAAYSSADSALTALTTSFTIDILNGEKLETKKLQRLRTKVHILISILLFLVILIFSNLNDQSVIASLFKAAGFTYGPLLGLYAFGLFTKLSLKDKWVPFVCLLAPIISFLLNKYSVELFNGYQFGFEILIVNGLLTFIGLLLIKRR